jgi:hypothetical protein
MHRSQIYLDKSVKNGETDMSKTDKESKFVTLLAAENSANDVDDRIEKYEWSGSLADVEYDAQYKLITTDTLEIVQRKIEQYLIDVRFEDSFMVRQSGKVMIMTRQVDTVSIEPNQDGTLPDRKLPVFYEPSLSLQNFKEFTRNDPIWYPVEKRYGTRVNVEWKKMNPSNVWLDAPNRPRYDGMFMSPYPYGKKYLADNIIQDLDEKLGKKYFNTFDGWPLEPLFDEQGQDMPEKCELIKNHLLNNFCDGETEVYNWVMSWFAHKVQLPHKKVGTAINITGDEGSGKGLIFKLVMSGIISGSHFIHTGKMSTLTSRFAALDNCIMCFADEAIFTADKSQVDALKTLISEDTLSVERKFIDEKMQKSFCDFGFSSNHMMIGGISFNDRRNLVIESKSMAHWTDPERKAHFDPILKEIYDNEREGLRAFFGVLLKWDLSKHNLRFPPESKIRGEQKEMFADSHDKWWKQCILDENFGHNFGLKDDALLRWNDATAPYKNLNVIPKSVLYKSYRGWCKDHSEKYILVEGKLWKAMKKSCPSMFDLGLNIRKNFKGDSEVCQLMQYTEQDQLRCLVLPSISDCKLDYKSYFKSDIPEFEDDYDAEIVQEEIPTEFYSEDLDDIPF